MASGNICHARQEHLASPATGSGGGWEKSVSRDGGELFHTREPGNRIQEVTISSAPSFRSGRLQRLTRRFANASPVFQRTYNVTREGRSLALIEAGMVKGWVCRLHRPS